MKRLITFICLIVFAFLGYYLIEKGFDSDNKNLAIASYNTIQTKSEALTKKLASYDKKNQEEYDTAITSLNNSIRLYNSSKSEYEKLYEELANVLTKEDDKTTDEVVEEVIYSDKEKYKVDFLFVTLGNYGGKEGVDVTYQLTTSSTTDPNSTTLNYFLADLKFTVSGPYMNVANFISDLENDEKMKWEIRNFQMGSDTNGVKATFTIKDVPIDSESYIASSAPTVDPQDQNANPDANSNTVSNTVSNTTDGNSVSNNAVVNNTVSNTTTNTVVNNTTN